MYKFDRRSTFVLKQMTQWTGDRKYDRAINAVTKRVQLWTQENNIPADHGIVHYIRVMTNARKAGTHLSSSIRFMIILACLLHDVDDRKIKKPRSSVIAWLFGMILYLFIWLLGLSHDHKTKHPQKYPLATMFLTEGAKGDFEQLITPDVINTVLEMISYVSASENGASINVKPEERWKLIPRDADRVEALGLIGVERCYDYTVRVKMPIVHPKDLLATNEAEWAEIMKGRSLDDYVRSGGKSRSMMGHYIDKLGHLHTASSGDPHMQQLLDKGMQVLKQVYFQLSSVFRLVKISRPLMPSDIGGHSTNVGIRSPFAVTKA